MAEIETIYRARIDWDAEVDTTYAIIDKAFDWEKDVKVEAFNGNAVCAPYVEAESESKQKLEEWAGKVERYINRWKDAKLI